MDVSLVIRQRLIELNLDQRALAHAAEVTESYVSQLLSRKRPPPATDRTDIYEKMGRFLKLPPGELARLAELQRREGLKRVLGEDPVPLFQSVRALILRTCNRSKLPAVAAAFETAAFGELERMITQKLLEVAKAVTREQVGNEAWLRQMTKNTGLSFQELRVLALEFLDTTAFTVSLENYGSFLEPLIDSWDIDLTTFDLTIALSDALGGGVVRRFGFLERELDAPGVPDGYRRFLEDPVLSGSATEEELALLGRLTFAGRRPTALFYYRELQNLRDPLHFEGPETALQAGAGDARTFPARERVSPRTHGGRTGR